MDALLRDLVLVFLIAGAVLVAFNRFRLPGIVGLLIAGVLIGPHALGILHDRHQIDQLAELGILLLMFSIGLDFTPQRLKELARAAGMGAVQMAICIVGATLAALLFVERWAEALFVGFLISHSSSALITKLFLERGERDSPQLRLGLGINVLQDLASVPMLLAIPMLAGQESGSPAEFGLALLKVVGVLAVALGLARWVIPLWLHHVIRTRNRELFLIFLVIVCLGTAWATLAVGLSVALGAFLAGLAIAASPYSHQTHAEIVPFRDLLVSVFFLSIGMLLDVRLLWSYAGVALLVMAGVMVLKSLSGVFAVLLGGYPLRIAVLVGLALAQIGEFAFVLSHAGHDAKLLSDGLFQLFVLVAIGTMLVNPFLFSTGPQLAGWLAERPWLARFERGTQAVEGTEPILENHVVVAGYGLNGRTVVRTLRSLAVPHTALDLNPDAVQNARQQGESIVYGDCTRSAMLRQVRLEAARVYVVAISDPHATRQTVQVARHLNPALEIIVRTRYLAEIEVLRRLGADEVIAEEFETSLEILARVLHAFQLPRLKIEEIAQHFRGDLYEACRGPLPVQPEQALLGAILPKLQIEAVGITSGSPGAGQSLRELKLRERTGVIVLAVQHNGQIETVPPPDRTIREGETVILAGSPRQILDALRLLEP